MTPGYGILYLGYKAHVNTVNIAGSGFKPYFWQGPFNVKFASSPRACVGFPLHAPASSKRHAG